MNSDQHSLGPPRTARRPGRQATVDPPAEPRRGGAPLESSSRKPARVPRPRMPGTLAVGVTAICVSALTSAVTAALIFTFGRQLLASELADIVNQRTGETLTPASLLDAVDGPDAVMRHRAVIWWVIAAVYLLLALPVRFGHFGAKAVLSVCVPVFGGLLVWDLHDKVPTVFRVLDGGAILTAVTAVVLIWLEPSNNYRRLRKEAARARRAGVAA